MNQNKAELELVNQMIGFLLLRSMRFEEASSRFVVGNLHPLILIKLFPDLAGEMISPTDEITVCSGILNEVKTLESIDGLGEPSHSHLIRIQYFHTSLACHHRIESLARTSHANDVVVMVMWHYSLTHSYGQSSQELSSSHETFRGRRSGHC